jgi:hypothetical protein
MEIRVADWRCTKSDDDVPLSWGTPSSVFPRLADQSNVIKHAPSLLRTFQTKAQLAGCRRKVEKNKS